MPQTPPESKPLRRLYRHGLKYKGRLALGTLLGFLGGGSVFGMLASLSNTTNSVLGKEAEEVVERNLNGLFEGGEGFFIAAAFLILFFLISGICNYFAIYHINYVGFKVVEDLRRRCFHQLQVQQLAFYNRHSSGELISRVTHDTLMVQHAVSGVVADIVRQPVILIAALAFMIKTDPLLALISLVIFPICIAPVVIFGRKVRKYAKKSQEHLAGLSAVLQENVSGVRVVKSFGMEAYEESKFDHENRNVFKRLIKTVLARNVNQPLMELVAGLGIVAIMMYVRVSQLPVGDFFAFAAALGIVYQPVKMLSKVHMEIMKAMGSAERIFALLDEEIEVLDPETPRELPLPVEQIRFEQVHFSYTEQDVLSDISLDIQAGEHIALVGGSGSGKSTLVSLLPRFFDPREGRVSINGVDLKDLSLKDLRRQIALVTQDTFLFNDSIARNIAYGHEDVDQERLLDAAKRAHAHEFILEQPNGYDSLVGERGGNLSGGQKQRLAIARAIYYDAPILILDEATSALDNESERQVQAAIQEVMKGRTSISIAHRLSTIRHSDRIVVMERGNIVEIGSHDELLKLNGAYKALHELGFDEGVSE